MLNRIFAEDIMTEDVIVIKEEMLIGQVAHLMLREGVSGYPVVDGNRKVIGIVTMTDLFTLVDKIANNRELIWKDCYDEDFEKTLAKCKNKKVSEIMSKKIFTIAPKTPLRDVLDAVVKWNIHTFPVMDGNKLVGILGRHDVLNATFTYA
jgi:CBS domain-containing protein